jgi:hypothetical protein
VRDSQARRRGDLVVPVSVVTPAVHLGLWYMEDLILGRVLYISVLCAWITLLGLKEVGSQDKDPGHSW